MLIFERLNWFFHMLYHLLQLYAYSQMFELPIGNYKMIEDEVGLKKFDLFSYGGERGCFVTCDLRCPLDNMEWVERYERFPLGQKKIRIEYEQLSKTQQTTIDEMCNEGMISRYVSQTKLLLSYYPLINHTIHYTELQEYVSRGMIMTNVTRIMEFDQKPFLRPFIETFTRERANSTSATKKNAFKMMLNSTYGRFGLNVMKHVNCHLALSRQDAKRHAAKHNFKSVYVVHQDLSVFTMKRTTVKYRQHWPIAAAILAISKTYMYKLYYDRILTTFPDCRLLSMDTDSFILAILLKEGHPNFVNSFKELEDLMDFSNLNESDPLFNLSNASRPGALKSETKSLIILSFAISSAKHYHMLLFDPYKHEFGKKVASKGLPRIFLSRRSFNEFRDSILKVNPERIQFNSIRGVNLDVATLTISKLFLSPFSSHRYILPDQIHSLPFGHPSIPNSINSQENVNISQSTL